MFGVTTPGVTVWLWLTVGLLLAPAAHRVVPVVPRAVLVRIALARVLTVYAASHPGGDAAQAAVDVSLEAVRIGPRDAAALVVLAGAFQAAGSLDDAEKTARLARSVAPAYAAQTLGSLGLYGASTP